MPPPPIIRNKCGGDFMAKKKILKLNDEQYYKYIMSLKNACEAEDTDGKNDMGDPNKKSEDNKNK